jgi:hypothetical protein
VFCLRRQASIPIRSSTSPPSISPAWHPMLGQARPRRVRRQDPYSMIPSQGYRTQGTALHRALVPSRLRPNLLVLSLYLNRGLHCNWLPKSVGQKVGNG